MDIEHTTQSEQLVNLILSSTEKLTCLKEIRKKNKRILYVYEQSLEPSSGYDYKVYIGALILYVSTSDTLFEGQLTNILINLKTIYDNELNKQQIRSLVHENTNKLNKMLKDLGDENGSI
jgi:hypothetical protein